EEDDGDAEEDEEDSDEEESVGHVVTPGEDSENEEKDDETEENEGDAAGDGESNSSGSESSGGEEGSSDFDLSELSVSEARRKIGEMEDPDFDALIEEEKQNQNRETMIKTLEALRDNA
ncbi:MAG: hypothetical protein ABEJ75_03350, partial [Candidatus Nanohaloarchaea archaeon]